MCRFSWKRSVERVSGPVLISELFYCHAVRMGRAGRQGIDEKVRGRGAGCTAPPDFSAARICPDIQAARSVDPLMFEKDQRVELEHIGNEVGIVDAMTGAGTEISYQCADPVVTSHGLVAILDAATGGAHVDKSQCLDRPGKGSSFGERLERTNDQFALVFVQVRMRDRQRDH